MFWQGAAVDGVVFPAPPSTPDDIELKLTRFLAIEMQEYQQYGNIRVALLGGFGLHAPKEDRAHVKIGETTKSWVAENADGNRQKKRRGVWKQQVQFQSQFELATIPAFRSPFLRIAVCCVFVSFGELAWY